MHWSEAARFDLVHNRRSRRQEMPVSDCELTQMFEHVLKLSRVDPTQSVAVLKSH